MKLSDKQHNMWTGLWVVCAIALSFILLPFVLPLLTAIISFLVAILIGGILVYSAIVILTGFGSAINGNWKKKPEEAKQFNKERTAQGQQVWQKTKDTVGDWLWLAGTKLRSKGEERKDEK